MSLPNSFQSFKVKKFAREAREQHGDAVLADFPRLLQETADPADVATAQTPVRWRLQGQERQGASGHAQSWLLVQAEVTLELPCLRCLHPVTVPLKTEQWFRFVDDVQQAEREDADADEDVLTYEEGEHLHSLMEDDLLMALPALVGHDVCPVEMPMQVQDADFAQSQNERKNPFEALAALKAKLPEDKK